MDDYGTTFFDLAASSSSYTLSAGTGLQTDICNFSSSSHTSNCFQEQLTDLDELLATPSSSLIDKNSVSISDLKTSPVQHTVVKSERTAFQSETNGAQELHGLSSENSSLDAMLEECSKNGNNPVVPKTETKEMLQKLVTVAPGGFPGPNIPMIVNRDGTKQPLAFCNTMHFLKVCKPASFKNSGCRPVIANSLAQMPTVEISPVAQSHPPPTMIVKKQNPQPLTHKPDLNDPSHLKIIMSNVVVSFRVRCHLTLRKIALDGRNVVYQRESQKVVMRLKSPRCTAYIWSSGKIVCTGTTSEAFARKASRKIARRLQIMGFKVKFAEFKVVNVLAVSKMPYAIDINDFSQCHRGKNCSYEPELHPGITYRVPEMKATLKIFSTGSVTVTARSVQRAEDAIKHVYPMFKPFYKLEKPNLCSNLEETLLSETEDLS